MSSPLTSDSEYLSQTFANLIETDHELDGLEFEACNFIDCNFTASTFRKCRFIECTFTRCNFSLAKVPQSRFNDVAFDECKMVGIDWTKAAWPKLALAAALKFRQCILNDSSFFGLSLDEVVIEQCKAHDVDWREGSFRNAVFAYSDLSNSLFGKTDLSGADFQEAANYDIDILDNKLAKARFSRYEAVRLLSSLDIELLD